MYIYVYNNNKSETGNRMGYYELKEFIESLKANTILTELDLGDKEKINVQDICWIIECIR